MSLAEIKGNLQEAFKTNNGLLKEKMLSELAGKYGEERAVEIYNMEHEIFYPNWLINFNN